MAVPIRATVSLLAKGFFSSWCPAVSPYRRGGGAWGSTEALGIGHVLPLVSCRCEPAGECRAPRASEEEACDLLLPYQTTWVVYKGKLFIWPAVSEACKMNVRPLSGPVDAITVGGGCRRDHTVDQEAVEARLNQPASQHSPF